MRKDRTVAAVLALFGLALCSFTLRGSLSFDEETLYLVTEGLWERGEVTVEGSLLSRTHTVKGRDGRDYSFYECGQSIAGLPFYALGKLVARALGPDRAPFVTRFAVNHEGAVAAGLTLAVTYLLLRRLAIPGPRAVLTVLLLAAGTPLWFYGRTFYREPTLALCFISCAYALVRSGMGHRRAWLAIAGGTVALAVLVKSATVIIGLPAGLFLLLGHRPWRAHWRPLAADLLSLGLPVLGAVLCTMGYNHFRFGTLLMPSSMSLSTYFGTPFLEGLLGTLFSPGRGLCIFAPLLWLVPAGLARMWRQPEKRPLAVFLLAAAFIHLGLYSKFMDWHGGSCWGPRYQVPLLPLAAILLGELLADSPRRPLARTAFAALAAYAILIQASGVMTEGRDFRADPEVEVPFHETVYAPERSTALNPALWAAILEARMDRVQADVRPSSVRSPEMKAVRRDSIAFWWVFLHRLRFPPVLLVPALIEGLLALASGAWLIAAARGRAAPGKALSQP